MTNTKPKPWTVAERRQFRDAVGFIPERMERYLRLIEPPEVDAEGEPVFADDAAEDAWWDRLDANQVMVEAGIVGVVWLFERRTNPELTYTEVGDRPLDEVRARFVSLTGGEGTEDADPLDGTTTEASTLSTAASS